MNRADLPSNKEPCEHREVTHGSAAETDLFSLLLPARGERSRNKHKLRIIKGKHKLQKRNRFHPTP